MSNQLNDDPERSLRTLRSFTGKEIKGDSFAVCALPAAQGGLTSEEYAAYVVAADGKHDSYMRHGRGLWAPGDLVRCPPSGPSL